MISRMLGLIAAGIYRIAKFICLLYEGEPPARWYDPLFRPNDGTKRITWDGYEIHIDEQADGRWVAEVFRPTGMLMYGSTEAEADERISQVVMKLIALDAKERAQEREDEARRAVEEARLKELETQAQERRRTWLEMKQRRT